MNNKFLLTIFLTIVASCGLTVHKAIGQVDPHFSQYYAYPLWLNPSLTGVMDGDYRISANYKRQWASITNPFSTAALSFDTHPARFDGHPFHHMGFGGTIINQSAGDGGYNYLNVLFSASFHTILDYRQMNILSVGIQGGLINRRFDPNKIQFGSQWNPVTGFDPGAASGEHFDKTSSLAVDANVGIFYYNRNPDTRFNLYGGASLYHLSRPYDPFLGNSKERLPMRLNLHAGVNIKLSSEFNLTPQFIYILQGNAYETVASIYGQYRLPQNTDLLLGANYRVDDAIIPFVGCRFGDFTLGMSYDVNISHLKIASLSRGGMEISLSYIRHKKIKDPRFICPRL